jgi:hypothetical protein
VVYASEVHIENTRAFCRETTRGFEGVFEMLTNQATGFAGVFDQVCLRSCFQNEAYSWSERFRHKLPP